MHNDPCEMKRVESAAVTKTQVQESKIPIQTLARLKTAGDTIDSGVHPALKQPILIYFAVLYTDNTSQ